MGPGGSPTFRVGGRGPALGLRASARAFGPPFAPNTAFSTASREFNPGSQTNSSFTPRECSFMGTVLFSPGTLARERTRMRSSPFIRVTFGYTVALRHTDQIREASLAFS